jgi:hypothetical protein
LNDVKEQERKSPKGNFISVKDVSIALGRDPESLDFAKGIRLISWRFDSEGQVILPVSRMERSRSFISFSGAEVLRQEWDYRVSAGEHSFRPGEAHQLSNDGDEDFAYYVIADNPRSDLAIIPIAAAGGRWKAPTTRL